LSFIKLSRKVIS